MSGEDIIKGRILSDGTIVYEAGDMHGVNHASADNLFADIGRHAGVGATTVIKKPHTHSHHVPKLRQS